MLHDVPSLAQLVKVLQKIPCLPSKHLYRVAAHFLQMDTDQLEQFCGALLTAKAHITRCPACLSWQETDRGCPFCTSPKRDKGLICVVESWHELLSIEKTGGYMGLYHVLGGVLSPLEGISPDDLSINLLIERLQSSTTREVIFAMNQTPEGEATTAYIANQIKKLAIPLTCLARGIPVGSSLEYMDRVTLHKALSERRPF